MLLSLLLAVAMSAPAPLPTISPLPDVVAAAPWGSDGIALFHADRTLSIASWAALRVLDPQPNAFGFPQLGVDDAVAGAGPHVFETVYTSTNGSHTIRTPCAGYNTVDDCATRHKAAVEALQRVYPKL